MLLLFFMLSSATKSSSCARVSLASIMIVKIVFLFLSQDGMWYLITILHMALIKTYMTCVAWFIF